MSGRPLVKPPARACGYPGCVTLTDTRLGFCAQHYGVAWPCSFDDSCAGRCAAHSRSRLCQEHTWYRYKAGRQPREE